MATLTKLALIDTRDGPVQLCLLTQNGILSDVVTTVAFKQVDAIWEQQAYNNNRLEYGGASVRPCLPLVDRFLNSSRQQTPLVRCKKDIYVEPN